MSGTGDPPPGPLPSDATGLLAPGKAGHRTPPRAGGPPSLTALEIALLGFAASASVSAAAARVLLAVFIAAWIVARRAPAQRPRLLWAALGIASIFAGEILACLVNRVPAHLLDPFREHWVLLGFGPLAMVAAANPALYRRAVGLAAGMGAVVGIYAVWQHFTGVDVVRGRGLESNGEVFVVTGTFDHHLTYGGAVMLLLLAAATLVASSERWQRVRGGIGLTLGLALPLGLALLWSYARSAWGGAFAGLVVLVAARRRRRLVAFGGLAVAALVLILVVDPTVRMRIRAAFGWREPPPRLLLWMASGRMLRAHPLGIGPGRFEELLETYKVPGRTISTGHGLSDYWRAALDGGPLGLLGYLGLVAGSMAAAAAGLRRRRQVDDGATSGDWIERAARRDLRSVALAASAAMLMAGMFQTYFWDREVVLLWILLAAPAALEPDG